MTCLHSTCIKAKNIEWLIVASKRQVFSIDCHDIFPRLRMSAHQAKHPYMLNSTLCQVKMLNQQPLALSGSTWYVISSNILAYMLLICIKIVNRFYCLCNRLELISNISTHKRREWGQIVWEKIQIDHFTLQIGQLALCHIILRMSSMSQPIHVSSMWQPSSFGFIPWPTLGPTPKPIGSIILFSFSWLYTRPIL